jgi:hypothetical protein
MLAEGTWTDSAVRTPLGYGAKVLSEYAGNWADTSGWSRHLGGVPRDSTDKVAEAVNPHFGRFQAKDGRQHNAVLSDVRIHPFTQKSRDMQEMVRHGLISFVSVEHGWDERYNNATRQMEATSLTFSGFAFVNKGACKLCRINEDSQVAQPAPEKVQDDSMDAKELESAIAAAVAPLTKELEALKSVKTPEQVKVETPRELTEALETIKKLETRVKELEKQPEQPKTTSTIQDVRELGTVEFSAVWDKQNGTVRSV